MEGDLGGSPREEWRQGLAGMLSALPTSSEHTEGPGGCSLSAGQQTQPEPIPAPALAQSPPCGLASQSGRSQVLSVGCGSPAPRFLGPACPWLFLLGSSHKCPTPSLTLALPLAPPAGGHLLRVCLPQLQGS